MGGMIHIVLASDENYAEFVATTIVSVFENSDNYITIHLLSNGICNNTIEKIKKHIPQKQGLLCVYDISDLKERLGIKVPNTIALATYSRLFVTSLLPEDIDKVIYLDSDVIIAQSIDLLWNEDISNYWLGGVVDAWFGKNTKTKIGLKEDDFYINAGVLLINLAEWRNNNLQQKFLDFLYKHNGVVYHSDQGIINAVCHEHIRLLPPRYNLTSNYLAFPYKYLVNRVSVFYTSTELMDSIKNVVCVHFTPGLFGRPWVEGCKHPMLDKYESAHLATLWKDAPLRAGSDSAMYRLVKWTYAHLPLWCYSLLTTMIDALLMVKMKLK